MPSGRSACRGGWCGRSRTCESGFTLIELMVSMVILTIVTLMVANIVRSISAVTSLSVATGEAQQLAATLFAQINRDVEGLTRDGVLLIRKDGHEVWVYSGSENPLNFTGMNRVDSGSNVLANLSVRSEDGTPLRVQLGRADTLAMLTTGRFTAQSDALDSESEQPYAGLQSNACRVIYAHTNRVHGNTIPGWEQNRGAWSTNWTLVRHQTLLVPMLERADFSGDGQPDYPTGDGSGEFGRGFARVSADVASITMGELLGYLRRASADGVYQGRWSANDHETAWTFNDLGEEEAEWALLRVKRDDLLPEQIFNRNPGDPLPTGYSYALNTSNWPGSNGFRFSEGFQRPRVLANVPAPTGVPQDRVSSTMYGRIIAPRCPHFRVDYTYGDVNERGELVWIGSQYHFFQQSNGRPRAVRLPAYNSYVHRNVWSAISPRTARQHGRKGVVGTADGERWPAAIRVQVVVVDSAGRDPIGYLYSRVITLPDL